MLRFLGSILLGLLILALIGFIVLILGGFIAIGISVVLPILLFCVAVFAVCLVVLIIIGLIGGALKDNNKTTVIQGSTRIVVPQITVNPGNLSSPVTVSSQVLVVPSAEEILAKLK